LERLWEFFYTPFSKLHGDKKPPEKVAHKKSMQSKKMGKNGFYSFSVTTHFFGNSFFLLLKIGHFWFFQKCPKIKSDALFYFRFFCKFPR
jgi:hypothetical protein